MGYSQSLGLYLIRDPRVGRVDAERNCISNVRVQGLAPEAAARRLLWLARGARRLGCSGVALQDLSDASPLPPSSVFSRACGLPRVVFSLPPPRRRTVGAGLPLW